MRAAGFGKEVENVENGLCAWCGSDKTSRGDFRDELSWKEYGIGGTCQLCQDKFFGQD